MLQNHISVCACTYKRPELLLKLLDKLQYQDTRNLFTYSVVIVDNDKERTAESIVQSVQRGSRVEIAYYAEKRQGISYARNLCVEKAEGEFIAFIDDDEFPTEGWLLNLFNTCTRFKVDGVIGDVLPCFEKLPPDWLSRGEFWSKYWGATGAVLTGGSTSNVLVKRSVVKSEKPPFHPDFGLSGGEDSLFFLNLIKKGFIFVACAEAIVYEFVPGQRMELKFLLKRYFLNGVNTIRIFRRTEDFFLRLKWFFKSVIAIAVYSVLLPVSLLMGRHFSVKYLLKLSYFVGAFLEFMYLFPAHKRSQYANTF